MTDTSKMRSEFEAAFVAEQVAKFGEGYRGSAVQLLKRDGVFLTTPSHYELTKREKGMYDSFWVEMVWWAWQASRQAVVVELPEPWEHYGIMGDVNDPDIVLDHSSVVEAIKAAGLRCEVRP